MTSSPMPATNRMCYLQVEMCSSVSLWISPDEYAYSEWDYESINLDRYFRTGYWELLAPVLTSLRLKHLFTKEIPQGRLDWLLLLRNLQVLEVGGWSTPVHITFPAQLSCPALRRLILRQFTLGGPFNLDCPSLEAFSFKEVIASVLPSCLDACNRLRVLKCSTLGSNTGSIENAWISAAVESVHSSLEELKVSGGSLSALPQCLSRCTRLQLLRTSDTMLRELPSLPLSLRVVDLRNNQFQGVPTQLEKLTGLTSLRLYSSYYNIVTGHFQITRDLRPIIRLPKLQLLELARDSGHPLYTVWTVQSLSYLGLAEHEIARSGRKLELKF